MRGARDSAGWAVGSGRVGWEPPLGPTCRRSSPSTGGVMTPPSSHRWGDGEQQRDSKTPQSGGHTKVCP